MSVSPSLWQTIIADVEGFIAKVFDGLRILKTEGMAIINWVDSNVPGAKASMGVLVQSAEADAVLLEQHAEKGLQDLINTGKDSVGTFVGNFIGASGIDILGKKALTSADTSLLNTASTILHALVSTEFTKAIAATAPKPQAAAATGDAAAKAMPSVIAQPAAILKDPPQN